MTTDNHVVWIRAKRTAVRYKRKDINTSNLKRLRGFCQDADALTVHRRENRCQPKLAVRETISRCPQ